MSKFSGLLSVVALLLAIAVGQIASRSLQGSELDDYDQNVASGGYGSLADNEQLQDEDAGSDDPEQRALIRSVTASRFIGGGLGGFGGLGFGGLGYGGLGLGGLGLGLGYGGLGFGGLYGGLGGFGVGYRGIGYGGFGGFWDEDQNSTAGALVNGTVSNSTDSAASSNIDSSSESSAEVPAAEEDARKSILLRIPNRVMRKLIKWFAVSDLSASEDANNFYTVVLDMTGVDLRKHHSRRRFMADRFRRRNRANRIFLIAPDRSSANEDKWNNLAQFQMDGQ
ncbi:hypothetical protein BV898_07885 [Hypsibius exemplaris]|uniref:Uncharacterized protein n=1 Tax=Hypsibius exemplaris TaxID=2072580 RepID=A0A1W0WSE7_HYPEX|nr:hypothetical protein BV898_07885 [Hypsibius exemplaris]